jgi:hypothetical protein
MPFGTKPEQQFQKGGQISQKLGASLRNFPPRRISGKISIIHKRFWKAVNTGDGFLQPSMKSSFRV